MQDPNLSQVSLCFFNVVPYGTQLFPDCNLASTIRRKATRFVSCVSARSTRSRTQSTWIQQNPDFSEKYLAAREVQADRLADEVIPIVDGERPVLNDEPNKDSAVRVSRDMGRAKYRVWKAGRMSPRKWGERIDANSNLGGIAPSIIVIRDSTDVRAGGASKADHRKEHEGD
jgi:terminase small subunit-like protein